MNIRIRQLKAFIAIVDAGSVTTAANEMNLTQSTVSKLLVGLEKEIGFDLFDRIGKRLKLTQKGRLFLDQAWSALEAFEDVRKSAEDIRDNQERRLRISAIGPLSVGPIVPKAIATLACGNPEISLTYDGKTRIEIEEWVAQGRANVGFTLLPVTHGALETKELATVSACAVVPKSHPLAKRSTLSPADLHNEPMVMPHSAARVRTLVEANFISAGLKLLPKTETSSAISSVYLVSQGAGISVLDPFSCMYVPHDQVQLIKWLPDTPMTYGMIFQSNRVLSALENHLFQNVSNNISAYLQGSRLKHLPA